MNPNSITTIIRVRATFTAGVDTDGSEKLVVKTIVIKASGSDKVDSRNKAWDLITDEIATIEKNDKVKLVNKRILLNAKHRR
jgi:hypothetical protein